jgi:hypothetical protein
MPLYVRTPKRTIDHYDPKQRLVGGVVLCLIILLIYFIFKMLIGLSVSAAHDGRYKLASAREDEVIKATTSSETTRRVVGNDGVSTVTLPAKPLRPLPLSFTFLDLDGNPMGKELLAIEDDTANNAKNTAETAGWVVEVASYRTEKPSKKLIEKLKTKGFEATSTKIGNHFSIHLSQVQPDKATAQKLSKQVAAEMGIRRVRIRENKPSH